MSHEIESADNGWIISYWVDDVKHYRVFEVSDDIDTMREDPQALIDLLYFVKEEICGQMYSKHKAKNVMVRMEGGEEAA